jgi:sensor histidine kinase YesM
VWVGVELLMMCIKLPYTYLMMYMLVPQYLIKRQYMIFGFWAVLGMCIGGLTIWYMYYFYLLDYFGHAKPKTFWSPSIVYKGLDLLYIATLPTVFKMYQYFLQKEQQAQQIQEQKLQAELELLKHQLHPHFLFNTLNNLYGMILTNDKNASEVVLHLSNLMSYMLYECNAPTIALEKEIAHLKNYIELEKIRYGSRLHVSFECGGTLHDKHIAPLLLIGFIENAFKHGANTQLDNAWIRVNLWVEGNTLDFSVENNLPADSPTEMPQTKGGIGLSNIRKRLELVYPKRHNLQIIAKETYFIRLKLELVC